jgi:hypothetical protein
MIQTQVTNCTLDDFLASLVVSDNLINMTIVEVSGRSVRFMDFLMARDVHDLHFGGIYTQLRQEIESEFYSSGVSDSYTSFRPNKTKLPKEDVSMLCAEALSGVSRIITSLYDDEEPELDVHIQNPIGTIDKETVLSRFRNKLFDYFVERYDFGEEEISYGVGQIQEVWSNI